MAPLFEFAPRDRSQIHQALAGAWRGHVRLAREIEAIRGRFDAAFAIPERPSARRDDLLASLAIFLIVVASTFPVVLPFLLLQDIGFAKSVPRASVIAVRFQGGLALGRPAGYGRGKAGFVMAERGTILVIAIHALDG
jgi:hypothetical protein